MHAALFAELANTVREHGGTATVFTTQNLNSDEQKAILDRFRADRAAEYKEFAERVQAFLAEIERESQLGKFTFAELEEIEDDFNKLSAWLDKIRARDFFPDDQAQEAARILAKGNEALRVFAEAVYRQEGVEPSPEDSGA